MNVTLNWSLPTMVVTVAGTIALVLYWPTFGAGYSLGLFVGFCLMVAGFRRGAK